MKVAHSVIYFLSVFGGRFLECELQQIYQLFYSSCVFMIQFLLKYKVKNIFGLIDKLWAIDCCCDFTGVIDGCLPGLIALTRLTQRDGGKAVRSYFRALLRRDIKL